MANGKRERPAREDCRARARAQRSIASFIVMDVMRAALAAEEAAGRSIIHMEVGQPGTPAPRAARDAAMRALRGATRSATPWRSATRRCARASRSSTRDWYGVDVAPERVVVTTGSSAAFVLAFLAVFDAGDAVALPSPGYPCYRHILQRAGAAAGAARDGAGDAIGCRRPEDVAQRGARATASKGC